MRGCPRQLTQPNFLHEVMDFRVIRSAIDAGEPVESHVPPKSLFIDSRQDVNHQMSDGSVSMLAASRIFHFASDRCLIGQEHMMLNGWPRHGVQYEDVVDNAMAGILAEASGTQPKKRKGKQPENQLALADLAGNAQCLADLGLVAVPLMFVLDVKGLHEYPLDLASVLATFSPGSDSGSVLDLCANQRSLRAMEYSRQNRDPVSNVVPDDGDLLIDSD